MIQPHQHAIPSPISARPALGWGLDVSPRIARGEGSYLYDTTGRRYLDGSGGPAAFGIGHDNPEVKRDDRESARRSHADTDIFSAASRSKS